MNRIIKFRAWDTKRKEMIYDGFVDNIGLYRKDIVTLNNATNVWVHVEIMQFTGLTDKNGKEIYEGDIVRHKGDSEEDYWDEVNIVEWNDKATGFYPFTLEHKWRHDIREIEVIGNIYENPDLLTNPNTSKG